MHESGTAGGAVLAMVEDGVAEVALGQPCPEGLSGPHETAAGVLDGEENRMLKAQFAELDCDAVQRIGRLNAGSKVASEMWQAVWMTVGSKDRRVCGGSLNEARTAGSAARRRHVHKEARRSSREDAAGQRDPRDPIAKWGHSACERPDGRC